MVHPEEHRAAALGEALEPDLLVRRQWRQYLLLRRHPRQVHHGALRPPRRRRRRRQRPDRYLVVPRHGEAERPVGRRRHEEHLQARLGDESEVRARGELDLRRRRRRRRRGEAEREDVAAEVRGVRHAQPVGGAADDERRRADEAARGEVRVGGDDGAPRVRLRRERLHLQHLVPQELEVDDVDDHLATGRVAAASAAAAIAGEEKHVGLVVDPGAREEEAAAGDGVADAEVGGRRLPPRAAEDDEAAARRHGLVATISVYVGPGEEAGDGGADGSIPIPRRGGAHEADAPAPEPVQGADEEGWRQPRRRRRRRHRFAAGWVVVVSAHTAHGRSSDLDHAVRFDLYPNPRRLGFS